MAVHRLALGEKTLHGYFSRDLAPVLEVGSGDEIVTSTLDGDWLQSVRFAPDAAPGPEWPTRRAIDSGHALVGPVAVRGARPGDALRVDVVEATPGPWGWSRAGGRDVELDRRLGVDAGEVEFLAWRIDVRGGLAASTFGHRVALRPFLGVIGLAPDEPGRRSTHPPGRAGGNIDCRRLVVGTSLYLPVQVDGALLSIGDGHAAQGDGELGSTAIECPMEKVRVRVELCPGSLLDRPIARTAAGWIVFGFGANLDDAAFDAIGGVLDALVARLGCTRKVALNLASQVANLTVTQIVNGVVGVDATIGHDALRVLGVDALIE